MRKTARRHPVAVRRPSRRPNRRRVSIPARLLPFAVIGLVAEVGVALFYSPRFELKTVAISGNRMASREVLLQRLNIVPETPLVKLSAAQLQRALEAEPLLAGAQVGQRWPDTLVVQVQERQAAFAVKSGGVWWETDVDGVAFRSVAAPAATLPQILRREGAPLRPGATLSGPTLETLRTCLQWSREHPEFRLASISLESGGKVCLNSDGGMPVRLGTPVELERKLETLTRLVADYPEIRAGYDIDYVNLYAWDAPAVLPKAATETPGQPLL
jgi:cell division protein FtsQ